MLKKRTTERIWIALGRLLAGLALILCLPLFFVLAVAVKLSSRGSILHISERLGQFGTPFQIYKFRTMHSDAESVLEDILESCPRHRQQWDNGGKLPSDPRITALGRFLRRSSLDELPQLCNILKGDMVWVGPRPIQEREIQRYGKDCEILHSVKPGLTGLWQVSGRSTLSYPQRVKLDLEYIDRRNARLDLKILLKTCLEIFRARGAC